MCLSILIVSVMEKFFEGGWLTVVVTSCFIALAFLAYGVWLSRAPQVSRRTRMLLSAAAGAAAAAVLLAIALLPATTGPLKSRQCVRRS